ncbi:hypothetical protein MTO96_000038 [Rhipicephalus appendiculatus]
MRRSPTTPKQTPLSRDNSKVVIRPRCSFEATWLHAVAVTDVLLSVTNEAARKNALSMDAQYKRLTVSLPVKKNASKDSKRQDMRIRSMPSCSSVDNIAPEDT